MDIGGSDFVFSLTTPASCATILDVVRQTWPDAVFQDGDSETLGLKESEEFFIYRNEHWFHMAEFMDDSAFDHYFYFILDKDTATAVCERNQDALKIIADLQTLGWKLR